MNTNIPNIHKRQAALSSISDKSVRGIVGRYLECSAHDLPQFASGSFDFVYAVDSFPYLFHSGMPLVEKHFEEVACVLKPGGDFLILEFSYRSDLESDRFDVARLASKGFDVLKVGTQPFNLWDGAAFHLRAWTSSNPKCAR